MMMNFKVRKHYDLHQGWQTFFDGTCQNCQ